MMERKTTLGRIYKNVQTRDCVGYDAQHAGSMDSIPSTAESFCRIPKRFEEKEGTIGLLKCNGVRTDV